MTTACGTMVMHLSRRSVCLSGNFCALCRLCKSFSSSLVVHAHFRLSACVDCCTAALHGWSRRVHPVVLQTGLQQCRFFVKAEAALECVSNRAMQRGNTAERRCLCLQKRWKKARDTRFSNKMMGAIKESALEGDSRASLDEV